MEFILLIQNIFILGFVHVVRLVLPLLALPLLAHVVTPEDFGLYMYAVSLSAWMSVFIEYGFNISATREAALAADRAGLVAVVRGTQSAKLLLTFATLPIPLLASFLVPALVGHPGWSLTSWLLAVITAFVPIYFFQGRERLKIVAASEAVAGVMTIVAIAVFVTDSSQFPRLPLILLSARIVALAILTAAMCRDIGTGIWDLFDLRCGMRSLRSAFHLFVFQAAVSFYTSFNVVFLGFFCSPAQVGIYASAERLMRAGLGFMAQCSNAIFPRLNALRLADPAKMMKLRRKVLIGFVAAGVAGVFVTWLIAPPVVAYMFGRDLQEIDEILNILALVIPAIAISNVLGIQYLLVEKKEKVFNQVIGCASFVNLAIAYPMVMKHGVHGMATTWVMIEWMISIALTIIVIVSKRRGATLTLLD